MIGNTESKMGKEMYGCSSITCVLESYCQIIALLTFRRVLYVGPLSFVVVYRGTVVKTARVVSE